MRNYCEEQLDEVRFKGRLVEDKDSDMYRKDTIRRINRYLLNFVMIALYVSSTYAQNNEITVPWSYEDGVIVTQIPAREEGQKSVLSLRTAPMEYVRVGFVGLGMRGSGAVERWTYIPGIQVVALCDYDKERAEACQKYLKNASMPPAAIYYGEEGYKELCKREDIDLVYIATDWLHHAPVAICAMENGKHVAIEVPSAMKLKDCWNLVNLSEQKQLHCFILENCCYDKFEMNTLNMAQNGVFGEIIRAQGAYIHDLSRYWNRYWKADEEDMLGWRLDYNMRNRGDVYPTHGLGPVSQALNIHRGDRMKLLVAMDTKSVIGKELVEQRTDTVCNTFRNGDHTTTLIRTEMGKVIEIQHDVMTPQPYSRLYQLTGTKGVANKYPTEGYALDADQMRASGVEPEDDKLSAHNYMTEVDKDALVDEYEHPIWKKYGAMAEKVGGHGGMDFVMDSRLIYCLQNGLPLDMDVYDLAEWCCLAELGTLSMDHHCAPVAIPDFTRGDWNKIKGYKHAYASPEDEQRALEKAYVFTEKLKLEGAKAWETAVRSTTQDNEVDNKRYNLKGIILNESSPKKPHIQYGKIFLPKVSSYIE